MNNANSEIVVITEIGNIFLMKEEISGLAMVTLKLKRENY